MKRNLIIALFTILVASLITAAIIYREHWEVFIVIAVCLLLMAAVTFAYSSSYKLLEYLFWPRGVQSLDDRGDAVEIREIRKMPSGNQITKQEQTAAMKRIKKSDMTGVLIVFYATFIYFCGSLAFFYFTKVDLPLWADWFLGIVNVAIPFLVARFIKVKILIARAKGLVAVSRCASCGYNLKELPLADDGCTICPECGAAWMLQPGISQ